MFARHCDARGVNDVSLNTACPQPTRQPEAITSGLISDNDALDLAPGLTGFIAPTMQELQQRRLVGIEPLERLTLDARDNRCNEPLRLAHLEQSRAGQARNDFRERPARDGYGSLRALSASVLGDGGHAGSMRSLVARYAGLTGSPDESGKRRLRGVLRAPVTLAFGAA